MPQYICSIKGCDNPHMAKGLCNTHYYRQRTYGDPLDGVHNRVPRQCSIHGCTNKHLARDLCEKHYARHFRRTAVDHREEKWPASG